MEAYPSSGFLGLHSFDMNVYVKKGIMVFHKNKTGYANGGQARPV